MNARIRYMRDCNDLVCTFMRHSSMGMTILSLQHLNQPLCCSNISTRYAIIFSHFIKTVSLNLAHNMISCWHEQWPAPCCWMWNDKEKCDTSNGQIPLHNTHTTSPIFQVLKPLVAYLTRCPAMNCTQDSRSHVMSRYYGRYRPTHNPLQPFGQ